MPPKIEDLPEVTNWPDWIEARLPNKPQLDVGDTVYINDKIKDPPEYKPARLVLQSKKAKVKNKIPNELTVATIHRIRSPKHRASKPFTVGNIAAYCILEGIVIQELVRQIPKPTPGGDTIHDQKLGWFAWIIERIRNFFRRKRN